MHIRRNAEEESSFCCSLTYRHIARKARKSEVSELKRRCRSSAAWRFSAGRSRGSWMESAAAITITSRTTPSRSASITIRAIRGSTGSWASFRPSGVSRLRWSFSAGSRAPSSCSRLTPSLMLRESGGSRNGKAAMSPSPAAVICRITEARLVRRISGSVNSGRERKSSSENSRMQMPSEVRPQRPLRWLALAWLTASIGSRWTLVRWL